MVPKNVHAWEIEGYAKIDKELRDNIRKKLKEKYGSLHKAEISLGLSDYYHRKLHETFRKKNILFRLIDESGINRKEAEKHITEWLDTKPHKSYQIKFPIKINPIYVRIISHLIGDGSIGQNFIWTQKDVTPLERLEKTILGRSSKNRINCITIPRILIKIVSKSLDLSPASFNKKELLERLVYLRKDYCIQVLTALIEDEGTVDKNRITIRMTDKEIMELLIKLIDSLGYSRSNLTQQKYKYKGEEKEIWKVDINLDGIKRYCLDLEKIENVYGSKMSLWKKRKKIKDLSTHKSTLVGYRRNKALSKEVLKVGRFKNISFDSIKRQFLLSDDETASVLRYLINKNEIERISRGRYIIKNEVA